MISIRQFFVIAFLVFSHVLFANRKGPDYFDVLHYRFDVSLNDTTNVVAVQSIVNIAFPEIVKDQILLDLDAFSNLTGKGMKVHYALVNQQTTHFEHEGAQIAIDIPHNFSKGDTVDVALSYSGVPVNGLIISKNQFGERTFFADHWPNRAHFWLPVVDHPGEKATCEFRVTAPNKYQVVANGIRQSEEFLKDGIQVTHWKEDIPIPVKVMVIGVADFETYPLDKKGFSTAWLYEETGASGAKDFQEAKDVFRILMEKMEEYPFSKLDHVESTTLFAGMENAGNIFYDEKAVNGDGQIGGLIAHEVGHQWFGNAVSEADWGDVWLSESFAEFLQIYYIEKKYGIDSLILQLAEEELRIRNYEDKHPNRSIRLSKVDNPKNVLSPLVYEKGARVLRMLNYRIGEDLFWEILRTYYQQYKYSNATTEDFIAIAEKVSEQDLSPFFTQWLDIPGKPKVSYSYRKKGKKVMLTFTQHTDHIYDFHLDIAVNLIDGTQKLHNYSIEDKETVVTLSDVQSINHIDIDPLNIIYGDITFH